MVAFISALGLRLDVIVLSECWTNLNNPPPNMNDYNKYWTHTSLNQNDGVVVYVRSDIVACVNEPRISEGNCLIVTIKPDYTIICSYRPPSFKNPMPYLVSLEDILCKYQTKNVIFTGDINIDILPDNLSSVTQEYLNLMALHGLRPGVNKPTRIKTCIDHFMVKCAYRWKTAVFEQPITDHCPILLYINSAKIPKKAMMHKRVKIDYTTINKTLSEESWESLYNATDISIATDMLTSKLINIITNNTSALQQPNRNKPIKPWITKGVVKCIRKRDRLHKAAIKTPDNILLHRTYQRYRNTCNHIIKNLKKQYYQERLNSSKGNIKKTWEVIKEVCEMKKNIEPTVELLDIDVSPKQSLDTVNNFFTGVGEALANSLLTRMGKTEQDLSREAAQDTSPPDSMSFVPTDPYEVRGIILGLRSHTAPGWDKITAEILKQNVLCLAPPIAYMCNLSLSTGRFPSTFKKAVVCPIFKSGNKDQPNNYRPISLLSVLSKILEKVVNRRVIKYLESNKLLSDFQFGFRENKSTEDAVLALTSTVVSYLDKGDKCLGVFLDLQKAFDTVSIKILLTRLENVGIRGLALDWFKDYLTNRSQRVRVAGYESNDSMCKYGVPQGSTLGPTLFLVYINSLCKIAASQPSMDLLMFADDTVLVFHGRSWDTVFALAETTLAEVTTWLENSLLSLNTSKTKYVCFSKTSVGKPAASHHLKIHTFPCNRGEVYTSCDCATLSQVASVRYLGVTLDDQLTWTTHLSLTIARIRKLVYIFKNLRTVATGTLLVQTYRALCECIIRYCICAWGGAAKTHMIGVERAQRLVLKVLLYLPYRHPTSLVYELAGVLSVRKIFVYEILRRYHKRVVPHLPILLKRVERCPVPRTRSKFARRFYCYLAPHTYNKYNRAQKVNKLSNNKFKIATFKWLKSLDYVDVENLLKT